MKGVLVAHPVHQHAYETAIAAQRAGVLQEFITGFYATGRGVMRAVQILPSGRLRELTNRRYHPDLDPDRVRTIMRYHLLGYGYRAIAMTLRRDPFRLDRWAHRQFDSAVARRIESKTPAIVHAFEGFALDTFRVAKARGAITILDVASASEYQGAALGDVGGPRLDEVLGRLRAERRLADALVVPSTRVETCLLENGVPRERIVRAAYGVDPARFKPTHREKSGPFRLLFVGRVCVAKGVPDLLEAWRRADLPDAELILVGPLTDGGARTFNPRNSNIRWVGAVGKHQVHEWFRLSDAFVLPSLSEGSANVIFEAMASGLPVITTPSSGSVIRDGLDGLIVPVRDTAALAAAIRTIHGCPQLRKALGSNARQTIEGAYTWDHYHERIGTLYERLLGESVSEQADVA
jgi:glycosyltransferase involved in cell wall biosynthesis